MYNTILTPSDGTDSANQAAEYGFNLAEYHDANVHLISVIEASDNPFYTYDGPEGDIVQFDEDTRSAFEKQAANITNKLEERAVERGLNSTTNIRHGFAAEEIVEYATEHDIDLIVMGTHGHSGIERILIGSTTERVVRTSEIPVLVVRTND